MSAAWKGQNYAAETARLIEKALTDGTKVLGGPEGDTVLGYTLPNGLWLMLQANVRNLLDTLPPIDAPAHEGGGEVREAVQSLITELGRWDRWVVGANQAEKTGANKVKAEVAARLIAILASPAEPAAHSLQTEWVMVPSKPTLEMVRAGWQAIMEYPDERMMAMGVVDARANVCYRAMLAASPPPPSVSEPVAYVLQSGDGKRFIAGSYTFDRKEAEEWVGPNGRIVPLYAIPAVTDEKTK